MDKIKQFKPKKFTGKKFQKKQENAREKGYCASWEKYRWRFLHHNPTCYICNAKSNVCDHIRAVKGDVEEFFWKSDNFCPMCNSCHSQVTGMFDRCNPPKTEEKVAWIRKERAKNFVTSRIKIVPFKKGSGL